MESESAKFGGTFLVVTFAFNLLGPLIITIFLLNFSDSAMLVCFNWSMRCWIFYGAGPRELGGARDLITQYKLLPHHEFFCKRSLPESLSDAHYLHNVVGDTDIRKGEGMQLDQLIPNASHHRDGNARIQPFVLDELKEAFEINDTSPVELPPVRICSLSIYGLNFLSFT